MKFLFLSVLANLLISGTALALHPACQSENRCLYVNMGTYAQNDKTLENFIGQKINVKGYKDSGLCVPTSTTNLLTGVLREINPSTKLNDPFLSGFLARPWYENLYELGKRADTDFKNGGTPTSFVSMVLQDILKKIDAKIGKKFVAQVGGLLEARWTTNDVITRIKSDKYAFIFSGDRRTQESRNGLFGKVTWYERKSGHSMIIKGFDGDRLHIQDPWGQEYFARLKREDLRFGPARFIRSFSVLEPADGGKGWMKWAQDAGYKLTLSDIIGIRVD